MKPQWMMDTRVSEWNKYFFRFVIPILIAGAILYFFEGYQAIKIICYKLSMILIATSFADFLWAIFFKRVLGKMEDATSEYFLPLSVFRGIWSGAIILAICLGL
jgi:hypothetical protein